jgi:hypothetical protein
MDNKIYYIHTGGNGARYIINLTSVEDITLSLEFYKPLDFKHKLLRNGFFLYMCIWSLLRHFIPNQHIQGSNGVQKLLSTNVNNMLDYNIGNTCSAFISSSNDKIIVNHHGDYYEKFSFGRSYVKSCNEINTYSNLQSIKTNYFSISEIRDIRDYDNHCSFKLYNSFNKTLNCEASNNALINALVEFFLACPTRVKHISDICAQIRNNYATADIVIRRIAEKTLNRVESTAGNTHVQIGLVHGDFKIWNIQPYKNTIHIYDFEESKMEGLPLEDLYNYYIDQMIMTGKSNKQIINFIDSTFLQEQSSIYLQSLGTHINGHILLLLYLLNRLYFYMKNNSKHIVTRYHEVLNHVLDNNNKFEHMKS